MKRTRNIVLLFSGALATTLIPTGCSPRTRYQTYPPGNVADVNEDEEQENDSYLPGVGYYHAPYRAWFPYRWNHYEPSRGYYYGGQWHPAPYGGGAFPLRTRPFGAAVAAARAALRGSGTSSGTIFHSPGSSPWAHSGSSSPGSSFSTHSVIRGGFGGSAHSSSS